MVTFDEFPHHDAHRYENDARQAPLVIMLLAVFWIAAALFVMGMTAGT